MGLVVLIEDTDMFKSSDFIEADMRRWWRGKCKRHITTTGEMFFEVGQPVRFNLYEGVKRLASFGVKARVARRNCIYSPY